MLDSCKGVSPDAPPVAKRLLAGLAAATALALGPACAPAAAPEAPPASQAPVAAPQGRPERIGGTITVYSGRTETLVNPVIQRFQTATGVEVKVRYGDTAELAAAILEEGKNSPADVYFAQDAGALGALAIKGSFRQLPEAILNRVDDRFRSPWGQWVGISGRARVIVYNTGLLREQDLPDSLLGFTDPRWKGKIGWAPTNGSFQAFVSALRLTEGHEGARRWLEAIKANNPKAYRNNTSIVQAVSTGEVEVGFPNHYYLYSFLKEQGPAFPVRNYHPRAGGAGAMVNVAGAATLTTSKNPLAAEQFIGYLLSQEAQQYFADETFEYPLVAGVKTAEGLVPLAQINHPRIDLGSLADLEGTLKLLREVGIL